MYPCPLLVQEEEGWPIIKHLCLVSDAQQLIQEKCHWPLWPSLLCVQKSLIPPAGYWAFKMKLLTFTCYTLWEGKNLASLTTPILAFHHRREISFLDFTAEKLVIKKANLLQLLSLWQYLTNFPWWTRKSQMTSRIFKELSIFSAMKSPFLIFWKLIFPDFNFLLRNKNPRYNYSKNSYVFHLCCSQLFTW